MLGIHRSPLSAMECWQPNKCASYCWAAAKQKRRRWLPSYYLLPEACREKGWHLRYLACVESGHNKVTAMWAKRESQKGMEENRKEHVCPLVLCLDQFPPEAKRCVLFECVTSNIDWSLGLTAWQTRAVHCSMWKLLSDPVEARFGTNRNAQAVIEAISLLFCFLYLLKGKW